MRARLLYLVAFLASGATGACGYHLTNLGVRDNLLGIKAFAIDSSPANIQRQLTLGKDELDATAAARVLADTGQRLTRGYRADVIGDEQREWVIGAGAKKCYDGGWGRPLPSAITIATLAGEWLQTVCRQGPGGLYGFAPIQVSRSDKSDLLLCWYPATGRSSQFELRSVSESRIIATWNEHPATCAFGVAAWNGQDAVFVLHGDALVIKSPQGEPLLQTALPDAHAFRDVAAAALVDGSTVLVASGNGYTPFHMVAVIDRTGELIFHEVEQEHAYRLEVTDGGRAFDVWTRSTIWRYTLTGT